jgi:hypothetical protein
MTTPPPVIAALPVSGLVSNLICDDGSLELTNPQGNLIVVRAKVIAATAATPVRNLGTVYTNGKFLRQIYAAFHLEGDPTASPSTGPTLSYHTVSGGVSFALPFMSLDGFWQGSGLTGFVTFPVDANEPYSVTVDEDGFAGTASVVSWLEVDVT